jgi:hypothetical protein
MSEGGNSDLIACTFTGGGMSENLGAREKAFPE